MRTITALMATFALLSPTTSLGHEEGEDHYGPEQGDVEFTLGANGSNDNDFDAGGFGAATSLGFFLSEGFELGARHNMTFFDSDDVDANFAAVTRGFLDYHFDFDRFQPFIGINSGLRYGNGEVDETGVIAPEWGLKLFVKEKAFILAMMEYEWFFDDIDDADDRADDGQFVYALGIGLTF